MDVDHVKSGEQMDVLTMIQQMGKFQELFEFTELQASAFSGEAFGTSNGATSLPMENPNAVFPSYNLQSTVSMNNSTDPVGQPCFLPYSATGRWRSQVAATGNADAVRSQKQNSMAAMREMIYRMAAMQPIHIDPEAVKPPKRRNVKISKDPQSVAARHRRERISERIRILQRIVPGGTKMDTASMLDEAIHYVKFLKNQVQSLELAAANRPNALGFPAAITAGGSYLLNTSKQYHIAQNGHDHMEDA